MNHLPLKIVLIGFGKIAAGYADDPVMARYFPYATHAQVLHDHPAFSWDAVVDSLQEALDKAKKQWNVRYAARTTEEIAVDYQPDVAVIATPPETRLNIIERLPSLRAILVEKPLSLTLRKGREFIDMCKNRNVLLQVNFVRRADEGSRALAGGQLDDLIGKSQAAFGIYGNGLLNNGSHMVDLTRMFFGEIESVRALSEPLPFGTGDFQVTFVLKFLNGLIVTMNAISFTYYRENSLDIWGEKGRLSIMQEGLGIYHYPVCPNRAVGGEKEISSDRPSEVTSTIGSALYHMYSNLAEAVNEGKSLWSDGDSALRTSEVLDAVLDSAQNSGKIVHVSWRNENGRL